MKIKFSVIAILLALAVMTGVKTHAANVDENAARLAASNFIKCHSATASTLKAPALADLKLTHAEASTVDPSANAYYAFNIEGGGFIIVSGDDRVSQVLGYSDKGRLDIDNLPENLLGLLDDYKRQIEYLQAHPSLKVPRRRIGDSYEVIVEPMITTTWGQQMPYYLQCPVATTGQHCKVGCSGVQMAQICYYWQYPVNCGPLESYYCSRLLVTLDELPMTTFDYSKMLHSYCHWDYDLGVEVQDTYTEEQVQEVAKLCRYVGQAAKMNYGPSGSASNANMKMAAMKTLGYNPNAKNLSRTAAYTTASWEGLMRAELDAGRPIMYGAKNAAAATSTSHAFIIDGYDSNGYFHINMGWYGHGDGWYLTTAIITTTLDGTYRDYANNQYMFTGIEPPEYCKVIAHDIDAESGLLLLGSSLLARATAVSLFTTYSDVDLTFTLTDQQGTVVASGDPIHVIKSDYVQRSDINGSITLPTSLADGTYDLVFNYQNNDAPMAIATAQGKLNVAGKIAKFNAKFNIEDVITVIDYMLYGVPSDSIQIKIDDVTMLIDVLLNPQ